MSGWSRRKRQCGRSLRLTAPRSRATLSSVRGVKRYQTHRVNSHRRRPHRRLHTRFHLRSRYVAANHSSLHIALKLPFFACRLIHEILKINKMQKQRMQISIKKLSSSYAVFQSLPVSALMTRTCDRPVTKQPESVC